MIRRPPRSTQSRSSAASDVYKRQDPVLWLGGPPDGERRAGKPEHLEQEAAAELAGVLVAVQETGQPAMVCRPGERIRAGPHLIEERRVPDVVQTERKQGSLNGPVDPHGQRSRAARGPDREAVDDVLDGRPDEAEDDADDDGSEGGDDRHEALAGEEPEVWRQGDPVVLVEQQPCDESDDDASEHPRAHRRDPQHGEGFWITLLYRIGREDDDPAFDADDAHRRDHHQVADGRSEGRYAVGYLVMIATMGVIGVE